MGYLVSEGHSFSTKRGILGPGAEITEKDFGTKEVFLKNIQKGKIVPGKSKAEIEAELTATKAAEASTALEAEAKRQEAEAKVKASRLKAAEAAVKAAKDALKAAEAEAGKADTGEAKKASAESVKKAKDALTAAEVELQAAKE